jgi:hypothetical protein
MGQDILKEVTKSSTGKKKKEKKNMAESWRPGSSASP